MKNPAEKTTTRPNQKPKSCNLVSCGSLREEAACALWGICPMGNQGFCRCCRYSVGDSPAILRKTRLKWVKDLNPTSKAISLTR